MWFQAIDDVLGEEEEESRDEEGSEEQVTEEDLETGKLTDTDEDPFKT